jgi:MarR family 2-MHQ and catechol resistance regulon transcriptional repressor
MSKPELKILIGLHRASNALDRKTSRIAAAGGLTLSQFAVLEALYHKGDLTVGQVQKAVLSTSGTIPVVVEKLSRDGYLTRCQDEKDHRLRVLHITDSGRALIARIYPENEEMIIREMDCWTDKEKEKLVSLLQRFGEKHNGKYG